MPDSDEIGDLAASLVAELCAAGKTVSVAESCTGGWIAKALTDVPGSSGCFGYGVVSYSNGAKESLLGVNPAVLQAHGAVSEPAVREMARGALNLSGADLAIAVSGVAGPGGGTDEKPVGTVWFAWACRIRGKRESWTPRCITCPATATRCARRASCARSRASRTGSGAVSERRLFFALWPSDRQRELLRDTLRPSCLLSREPRSTGATGTSRWCSSAPFRKRRYHSCRRRRSEVEMAPLRLRFDRLGYWPRAKVAALLPLTTPEPLEKLVVSLEEILKAFDVQPEDRVFRPHITVARRARTFDTIPLARPVDLEWKRFELVESEPAPSGSRYRPLKQQLPPDS
jgi:nicotinamide-nucleotide amidase